MVNELEQRGVGRGNRKQLMYSVHHGGLIMRYHQSITIVLAVFCLSVFLFAGCGQREEKKQSMTTEPKGEKAMAAQYSFDFPALSDEHIRQNYVSVPYTIHKNKLFNFSVLMNKNWNAVKVAEPSQIPPDGSAVEIGLLKLFSPIHDPRGDIKAQLVFYIAEIAQKVSAAEHLDKQLPLIYKDKGFKILHKQRPLTPTLVQVRMFYFHIPVTIHYSCRESALLRLRTIQKNIWSAKNSFCI